jgi:DNA-binding MarR family transcriptional regulator
MMDKYRILKVVNVWFLSKYTLPKIEIMNCTKEKPLARVTKKEYETLAAFRYRLRHFLRFSESAAEASGLTSRQYQALLAIRGFPARECVTIGELAEQLQIAHHSAVGLVNRLAVQNLVSREASTQDRRHVYVKLTTRGLEVLEELTSAHKEELRRLGACFNSAYQSPLVPMITSPL